MNNINLDYVYGLSMTDGCYSQGRYTNERLDGSIQVGFRREISLFQSKERGRLLLEHIKIVLANEGIKTGKVSQEKRRINRHLFYKLRIAAKSIPLFLNKRPAIPSIEFIAGIIDGDGSFFNQTIKQTYKGTKYINIYPGFSFCGNVTHKLVVFEITASYLLREYNIVLKKRYTSEYNFHYYSCTRKQEVITLAEIMKDYCYIKQEKIKEILSA